MSIESQQQIPDVVNHLERLNELLEGQMRWINAQSFTATDEAKTVEVTLDGHLDLVGLEIEDGLLRLGAETVQQRINEALLRAQAGVTEGFTGQHEQLIDSMSDIAEQMMTSVQTQFDNAAKMGLFDGGQTQQQG
ncbi:MAG: YbaB/EbfC family nucleoid-associated protein [Mycobacterium sp.]|jgi:DNA-binding protein YbaB